jgi:cytochrome c
MPQRLSLNQIRRPGTYWGNMNLTHDPSVTRAAWLSAPLRRCTLVSSLVAALLLPALAQAATIDEVLQKIDGATAKPKDTTTEFTVTGVVSVRANLKDDKVLAILQPAGAPGLPLLLSAGDAVNVIPRNELTLSGKLADGPLGIAVLSVKPASVQLVATNRPFGLSEPRGAEFFKDASSLAGRYVQLTNVAFSSPKFDDSGVAKVKANGAEVSLRVGKGVAGLNTPEGQLNVFGVALRLEGEWQILSARFLPPNVKAMQALATKHTCFTCHNPDLRVIGPAYREVAARYRKDADALPKLIAQMENGGTGKWGQIPMLPFKGKVPPEEMKQLAEWIMGYRWDALLAE